MEIKHIAILGGTGFVGASLCNRLAKEGYRLTVLTRNREYNRADLILLPGLDLVEADIHDQQQLNKRLAGCDAVINLVGILNERGNDGRGFYHAHVALAEKILIACRHNNIKRILQMSALNADAKAGSSHYLRSKGAAEDLLHQNQDQIQVTSFRPSVIFGPKDSFFNRFVGLLRISPIFFPLACYRTRFAPVYVADVVEMMARSINAASSYHKRFNLCGPKIYTLIEIVRYSMQQAGIRRVLIPLTDPLSRLQAAVFDLFAFAFNLIGVERPFSTDNYNSTRQDSVCDRDDFSQYGITPVSPAAIVPSYLAKKTVKAYYARLRDTAY